MILAYTHVFKPFARPIEITQKKSFQKYHKLVITNALLGNRLNLQSVGVISGEEVSDSSLVAMAR